MVLVADIGNTNITLGIYKNDELIFVSRLATQRHRTSEQYAIELNAVFNLENIRGEFRGAVISSVVPELTRAFKEAIEKVAKVDALVVAAGIKNGLKISTDNPKEVGADLVAGAVGAISQYELPCLVMDLGTATKISVIDEGNVFLGCTIAPGISISLDALSLRTSQLPAIDLSAPEKAIGTNTIECIKSGTVLGNAAMLDGMATRLEKELGKKIKTYNKNLVLEGLLVIYKKNRQ